MTWPAVPGEFAGLTCGKLRESSALEGPLLPDRGTDTLSRVQAIPQPFLILQLQNKGG